MWSNPARRRRAPSRCVRRSRGSRSLNQPRAIPPSVVWRRNSDGKAALPRLAPERGQRVNAASFPGGPPPEATLAGALFRRNAARRPKPPGAVSRSNCSRRDGREAVAGRPAGGRNTQARGEAEPGSAGVAGRDPRGAEERRREELPLLAGQTGRWRRCPAASTPSGRRCHLPRRLFLPIRPQRRRFLEQRLPLRFQLLDRLLLGRRVLRRLRLVGSLFFQLRELGAARHELRLQLLD